MSLIGIPYKNHGRTHEGCDCWGLVCLYHETIGVQLPSFSALYDDSLSRDREEITQLIAGNKQLFAAVDESDIQGGDVILLKFMGSPSHVAIVDSPGWMLNADRDVGVHRERYDSPRWKNRIVGFYRYSGLQH